MRALCRFLRNANSLTVGEQAVAHTYDSQAVTREALSSLMSDMAQSGAVPTRNSPACPVESIWSNPIQLHTAYLLGWMEVSQVPAGLVAGLEGCCYHHLAHSHTGTSLNAKTQKQGAGMKAHPVVLMCGVDMRLQLQWNNGTQSSRPPPCNNGTSFWLHPGQPSAAVHTAMELLPLHLHVA